MGGYQFYKMTDRAKDMADTAKEYAMIYGDKAKDYVVEYAPVIRERAKDAADIARERSKELADTAKDWAQDVNVKRSVYLAEQVTRTRKESMKNGLILFLLGVILGFLIAPIKRGWIINTDQSTNVYGEDECNCSKSCCEEEENI